jgi:sucrose phosphorylase
LNSWCETRQGRWRRSCRQGDGGVARRVGRLSGPDDRMGLDVERRPQLLTYPDSLGGDLRSLAALLDGPLAGLFKGVHILPPFPSSGDRGFAPVTYREIEPRFGTWNDIREISERHDVVLDFMINHLSRQSVEFKDFEQHGRASRFADLFITLDKIWPDGKPPPDDVSRIFLRKPEAPFSTITMADTGVEERVWTTFGTDTWSEQIDLDVTSSATREFIADSLRFFAAQRVRVVRLDAVGYVIKKPGTSCFMVEPEIYDFLRWISGVAESMGLVVLPEVHDRYPTHERLSAHGFWTYDFVLPGLLLHALHTAEARRLAGHLGKSPERQFTNLDCHDGIPVRPDLDSILKPSEMLGLADRVQASGGNVNRILSDAHANGGDVHQLNTTFYSALGGDDDRYVAARAIQLFARGVPQVYYVGLLAGENDQAGVVRTGDGRAVNRHDFSKAEIGQALRRPVVQRLLELVRLRNTHPAFDGELEVEADSRSALCLRWRNGQAACELRVDLHTGQSTVAADGDASPGAAAARELTLGPARTRNRATRPRP